jgi:hypothetical protein
VVLKLLLLSRTVSKVHNASCEITAYFSPTTTLLGFLGFLRSRSGTQELAYLLIQTDPAHPGSFPFLHESDHDEISHKLISPTEKL